LYNLAQKNLHVCRGFLYKFSLVQVFCTKYNAALLHARNLRTSGVAIDCSACAKNRGPRAWGAHSGWINVFRL